MLKAVMFDFDGVILDSEPIADQHVVNYLQKLGSKVDQKFLESVRGMNIRKFWETTKNHLKITHDIEVLIEDFRKSHLDFLISVPDLQPNPGLKELIDRLLKSRIKLAVASSANPKRIQILLELFKLDDKFEIIISGDDIAHSKPAPDAYLLAAKKLKIDPKNCIAIEDAKNGVISAKSAGMKVVAYAASHNKQDLSAADLIIRSFDEITLNILEKLIKRSYILFKK